MKGARAAGIAFWLGAGSVVMALASALGINVGVFPATPGLIGLLIATVLALIAAIAAIVALIRKPAGRTRRAAIGLVAAAAMLAFAGWAVGRGVSHPRIHEVSTDLADVPPFATIPVRNDRFLGLAGGEAEWRAIHAQAYGDLVPVTVQGDPAEVLARVRTLAEMRGWTIASETPLGLEATDTVPVFGFKDDVVIRLTPGPDGVRVDMRSISRVGIGDLGFNADRVRAFLADLKRG